MTLDELIRHVESLLFVAGEPVELAQLASALEVTAEEVEAALNVLGEQCSARGVRLQRRGQRVQLATAPDASPYVERFLGLTATTRLSQAALETLAIIAYRQPITRAEIEALRGVDCDGVLRTLMARQLIGELERLDTVGHPIRYGTTFEFMRYFGLQRLEDLPPLRPAEPQQRAEPGEPEVAPDRATPVSPLEPHDQSRPEAQAAVTGEGPAAHTAAPEPRPTDAANEPFSAESVATDVKLGSVGAEQAPVTVEPQPFHGHEATRSAPGHAGVGHAATGAEPDAAGDGNRPAP